jgi:hypothetical protein
MKVGPGSKPLEIPTTDKKVNLLIRRFLMALDAVVNSLQFAVAAAEYRNRKSIGTCSTNLCNRTRIRRWWPTRMLIVGLVTIVPSPIAPTSPTSPIIGKATSLVGIRIHRGVREWSVLT